MRKIILLIVISVVFSGCAATHYPVLRRATIDEDRYGISLSIPLDLPRRNFTNIYHPDNVWLNSSLSFEYIGKTSKNSNLGVRFFPVLYGLGLQIDYKYKINEKGDFDIAVNPGLELCLSFLEVGGGANINAIVNNNSSSSNINFYGGIGSRKLYYRGWEFTETKVTLVEPFLGIVNSQNGSKNFLEYFHIKYLTNEGAMRDFFNLKDGFAYKYSYKK